MATLLNANTRPKVRGNKVALFDIMLDGRFQFQMRYEYCPIFAVRESDIIKAVLQKRPTLRGKDFRAVPVSVRQ